MLKIYILKIILSKAYLFIMKLEFYFKNYFNLIQLINSNMENISIKLLIVLSQQKMAYVYLLLLMRHNLNSNNNMIIKE